MARIAEISGSFDVPSIKGDKSVSKEASEVGVTGKTNDVSADIAVFLFGDNGEFNFTTVAPTNFETSISIDGLAEGQVIGVCVAAGGDDFGGAGNPQTASDLESVLREFNSSSKTQSQLVEKLKAETVDILASGDALFSTEFFIQPTQIIISNASELSSFASTESVTVSGKTNVPAVDGTVVIKVLEETSNKTIVQTSSEQDAGRWESTIDFSTTSIDPGSYVMQASVLASTSTPAPFSIVSVSEKQEQIDEENETTPETGETDTQTETGTGISDDSGSTTPVDSDSFQGFEGLQRKIFYSPLEFEVKIGGTFWKIKDLKVNRHQYQQSGAVDLKAVPDPTENPNADIYNGDEITIDAGPKESAPDSSPGKVGNGLIRLFTGTISSFQTLGNGAWKINAFTDQLDFVTTRINYNSNEKITVKKLFDIIVKKVTEKTGSEYDIEVNVPTEQTVNSYGINVANPFAAVKRTDPKDIQTRKAFTNTLASEAVKKLERSSNAVFWVDRFNKLYFGETKTKIHKLNFVVESDARIQTPPYQSVKVIGSGSVTQSSGFDTINLVGKQANTASAKLQRNGRKYNVKTADSSDPNEKILEEPVFTYRDESIKTVAEAKNVARDLLEKLTERRGEGKVVIPGRPMIDVYDVIEMPDSFGVTNEDEQLPAPQYLVEEITHRVNPSDGFVTEIKVMGLVNRYREPRYIYTGDTSDGTPLIARRDPQNEVQAQPPFNRETITDS
jgi:hypothetical protein